MKITRRIEIDYGHTLPNHYSFCNQIHGHRGVIEATFEGAIQTNGSSEGMVLDFKECKKIMIQEIHERLDHGFAVWKEDVMPVINIPEDEAGTVISTLKFIQVRNSKVVICNEPPTAEYLAKWAFCNVQNALRHANIFIDIVNLRWYETPNNWADYDGED